MKFQNILLDDMRALIAKDVFFDKWDGDFHQGHLDHANPFTVLNVLADEMYITDSERIRVALMLGKLDFEVLVLFSCYLCGAVNRATGQPLKQEHITKHGSGIGHTIHHTCAIPWMEEQRDWVRMAHLNQCGRDRLEFIAKEIETTRCWSPQKTYRLRHPVNLTEISYSVLYAFCCLKNEHNLWGMWLDVEDHIDKAAAVRQLHDIVETHARRKAAFEKAHAKIVQKYSAALSKLASL